MNRSRSRSLLLAAALALASTAAVQAGPVTGNPNLDGWAFNGNSLNNGTFVYANRNDAGLLFDFDLYSTSFQLASGSNLLGNGWGIGDVIIGIGAVVKDKTATVNQVLDNRVRVLTKYGSNTADFKPSSAAPNDGDDVWKTLHPVTTPGDPTTNPGLYGDGHGSSNFAGKGGIIMDTPQTTGADVRWFNTNGEGTVLLIDGSVQPAGGKAAHVLHVDDVSGNPKTNVDGLGVVKLIYNLDNGTANDPLLSSFESFLNITLLGQTYGVTPMPGDNYVIALQQYANPYTKATGQTPGAVPEPSSLILSGLGLGGLGLAALRRRSRRGA